MKMRLIPAVAARDAWLIAGRSAAGAVLRVLTVSACTGGGSPIPSVFTPTPQTSGSSAVSGSTTHTPSTGQASGAARSSSATTGGSSAPASGSQHASTSAASSASSHASTSASSSTSSHASSSSTPRSTATSAHAAAPTTPIYPTAAPDTGGGGTAGLQDGLLFGVGGAAVLAGFGTLAVRRRLRRKFAADADQRHPAARESADR